MAGKKRKRSNGRKLPPLARMAGLAVNVASWYKEYTRLMANTTTPWTPGEAFIYLTTCYDIPGGSGFGATSQDTMTRLIRNYGGVIGGEAVHQFVGNAKGAFGTGVGIKANNSMPKGFSI